MEDNVTPEVVANCECAIGEAPLWNPFDKKLYWVDIPRGHLYRYDPVSGSHEICHKDNPISAFTIQADGSILLFLIEGKVKAWKNNDALTVIDHIGDESDFQFNDTIADPEGRVYIGVKQGKKHLGRLYRIDPDKSIHVMLDDMDEPNGMGFSPDHKHMFVTDTACRDIYRLDYDVNTGNISNRQVFIHNTSADGVPDGMTVDSEGFLWGAHWGGGCIIRYTPDGTEDMRIRFPTEKTSSLTFGGDNYTDIYITSAGGDKRTTANPKAGSLFHFNAGIRGVPEYHSRIGL